MTDKPTILLWIDIETTDATPDAQLLELYAAWSQGDNLVRVSDFYALSPAKPRQKMAPEVEAMHKESGLLADLAANWAPPTDADDWTRATLMQLWLENRRIAREYDARITLAGSGIAHFDVPWLKSLEYGARLVEDCTYWLLDVGILRRSLTATGLDTEQGCPCGPHQDLFQVPTKTHRAKDDVRIHAIEYKRISDHLRHMQNLLRHYSAEKERRQQKKAAKRARKGTPND